MTNDSFDEIGDKINVWTWITHTMDHCNGIENFTKAWMNDDNLMKGRVIETEKEKVRENGRDTR